MLTIVLPLLTPVLPADPVTDYGLAMLQVLAGCDERPACPACGRELQPYLRALRYHAQACPALRTIVESVR